MNLTTIPKFETTYGAEAKIELSDWYSTPVIAKTRLPKAYRNKDLDDILRRRRTREEAELLHAAKLSKVDCPEVYFVDPLSSEIVMENDEGPLLKDLRAEGKFREYLKLGSMIANLHSRGIIHGDLTTKNVIVSGDRLVLIDFGLSFISDRIEDRAEDLHLLKQGLKSSGTLSAAVSQFDKVLKGYREVAGEKEMNRIRKQIGKIELRGRYAQVD